MKYFASQRLDLKHNNLDRYDLLDYSSKNIRTTSTHCTLKINLRNKNTHSTNQNFSFANHLLLEWICNQKIKRTFIKQHYFDPFLITTLRKTKLVSFLDNCLNSLFLSNNLCVNKSTGLFTLNFTPDSVINECIVSNNISKSLILPADKIFFIYKSNFHLTQYLKVLE